MVFRVAKEWAEVSVRNPFGQLMVILNFRFQHKDWTTPYMTMLEVRLGMK